jgi:hypothetical protein
LAGLAGCWANAPATETIVTIVKTTATATNRRIVIPHLPVARVA